jgi:uncharacterized protein
VSIELLLSSGASFFAGLIDSIVGGGGLILVPALFSIYPNVPPATLLGTNKCAGLSGTTISATHYARRVDLQWSWLLPASLAAFIGALFGAWTVTQVDPSFLRKLLPFMLAAVLVYTIINRNLGLHHTPTRSHRATLLIAAIVGAGVGWYDGFFGPGTGSFFIFLFVRGLGFDFLNASASAKVMNVATNLAAFGLLALKGHVWWQVGIAIAIANVAGSLVGTRIALRFGPTLVRKVFLVVVTALILKTAHDAFFT